MMIIWRKGRGAVPGGSKHWIRGFTSPMYTGTTGGLNIIGTMAITEPGDIASFTGIVEIVSGGNGVIWPIMRSLMSPVYYAIMQSEENDS